MLPFTTEAVGRETLPCHRMDHLQLGATGQPSHPPMACTHAGGRRRVCQRKRVEGILIHGCQCSTSWRTYSSFLASRIQHTRQYMAVDAWTNAGSTDQCRDWKCGLTNGELPLQHRVQYDLILPQSLDSHPWERHQVAGHPRCQVLHLSLQTKQQHY